jgi:hypothetical protein
MAEDRVALRDRADEQQVVTHTGMPSIGSPSGLGGASPS